MACEPTFDVLALGPGELGRSLPWSVPRHCLGTHVAMSGPPGDAELPGDPRGRPPMSFVERVHHGPVLLTLHPSLLLGPRLRHRNRGRRDRPFLGTDEAPGGARGLCTFRDQDSAYLVIANKSGASPPGSDTPT